MPATDVLQLYDFETAIEGAWKTLLTDYGAAAFTQREYADLPDLRIDIQFALGAAQGHRRRYSGSHWLDAYHYRLTLGIVTPRKIRNVEQTTLHATYRAKCRIFAQYASGMLDDDELLPYHTLTQIQEDGTAPAVVSADDCDVSEIAFKGIVSIRDSAWPDPTFDSEILRFDADTVTFDTE